MIKKFIFPIHHMMHFSQDFFAIVLYSVLARFCPPGRNRAAEILSARAAEIPFALSFSPMGRNCLVVHVYCIANNIMCVVGNIMYVHCTCIDIYILINPALFYQVLMISAILPGRNGRNYGRNTFSPVSPLRAAEIPFCPAENQHC